MIFLFWSYLNHFNSDFDCAKDLNNKSWFNGVKYVQKTGRVKKLILSSFPTKPYFVSKNKLFFNILIFPIVIIFLTFPIVRKYNFFPLSPFILIYPFLRFSDNPQLLFQNIIFLHILNYSYFTYTLYSQNFNFLPYFGYTFFL